MLVCPECGGTYPVAEGFCPMDGAALGRRSRTEPSSPAFAASEQQAADALLGQTLERRYRLDALVGQGGMAFVFRGTHTLIGKRLAVKVLRPELNGDPDVVARFLREAQVVSSIKHPNVIDISDFGDTNDGGAFYVMEYLRGTTLADRIDTGGGPLDPVAALGIALQICHGLSAAHEQGVVHRDLKPENIFICPPKKEGSEPIVKLLDFGIARAGSRITVAGAVLGTPEYMSPEQAQGRDVDTRADLYSLGVILFEMLTGLVPFRSDDIAITLQSHIHASPPTLESVDSALAYLSRTEVVLARLLAKSSADRPESAAAAAEQLAGSIRADLGSEEADRVVRATMAIGSNGLITNPAEPKPPEAEARWDRHMEWNGPGSAPAPPVAVTAIQPPPPMPSGRRLGMPWVMGGAAVLAAVVTTGTYAAIGGFDATASPSTQSEPLPAASSERDAPTQAAPVVAGDPVTAEDSGPSNDPAVVAVETAPTPSDTGAPSPTPSTPEVEAEPAQNKDPRAAAKTPPIKPRRKPSVARTKGTGKRAAPVASGAEHKPTAKPSEPSTPAATDPPPAPAQPTPAPSDPTKDPPPVGDLKNPFHRK